MLTELQNRLGGTIKIIQILEKTTIPELKNSIEKALKTEFSSHKGKIPFAISLLNFKSRREINIKELLNFSKKIIKSFGFNCRFVNKDFKNNPAPSTIYKAKILKKGIELNIIKGKSEIYFGKTITIQDIDSYTARDYNKPKRDASVGMLPPKLAQIMINLTGPTKTIYDPFCGTGTIPMEGLLMSKDVIGTDIDSRMVEFSQKNCKWLEEKFGTNNLYRILEKDAQRIKKEDIKNLSPNQIDGIITEGYLGPPFSSPPSSEKQEIIFSELTQLHANWLKAAHKATPPHCKIVMCKTAYRIKDTIEHFPNFEQIAQTAGYRIAQTYTYDRPDQIVIRDIAILEKI